MTNHKAVVLLSTVLFSTCAFAASNEVPSHAYLTWRNPDTSSTITVNFHTGTDTDKVWVHYGDTSQSGKIEDYPRKVEADSNTLSAIGRRVHHATLTGLAPDAVYHFTVSDGSRALSNELKFRTLPNDGSTLRFVTGGDMGTSEDMAELNREAAKLDPMFALIGGDVAYANGKLKSFDKWDKWLSDWTEHMVRPDGSLIPMVLAIGNHEVEGGYNKSPDKAPFWFNYFAQEPGRTYFRRAFGNHTVFYILDTQHIAPIAGAQTEWLKDQLKADSALPNRLALYHVPLYPSVRSPDDSIPVAARKFWLPVFDKYQLTAAFENHDHALKRTFPLKGGERNAAGTVYFGDGCWGRPPRDVKPSRAYLALAESVRHFWFAEASSTEIRLKALDRKGALRDSYTLRTRR